MIQVVYTFLVSLLMSVMVGGAIWYASIRQPSAAVVGASVGFALAAWQWKRQKTLSRRIAGTFCGLVAVLSVVAFWNHQDGQVAARIDKERWDREFKEAEAKRAKERAEIEAKQRAEEERAARERQELAEINALKATNVDQYLERLKAKDPARWREELKSLRPKLYAAQIAEEKREEQERERRIEELRQRSQPLTYLNLDYSWSIGGFGTVMLGAFTVKSTLVFPVKDIELECILSGNSGTALQRVRHTLYETVPPKSTRRIANVNMGFIHSQSARASCKIVDVQFAG